VPVAADVAETITLSPVKSLWDTVSVLPALAVALSLLVAWGTACIEFNQIGAYAVTALVHGGLYLGAVAWVLRRPPRPHDLWLILGTALVLRGIAMTAPQHLSTDGLRYVWDGRIQWAGLNPYLHVPSDDRLHFLRDAVIYPGINQKDTAVTIYPPTAEIMFLIGNWISDSLSGPRTVFAACEILTVIALLLWLHRDRLPLERVLIYGWHPLPIWEFSSQAHIDSGATALLTLAIAAAAYKRQGLAGALLAAATLTKYFPIILAPALWRRFGWPMPVAFVITAALLYAPYVYGAGAKVLGFLARHLDNEGYGAGYGFHIIWVLRDLHIANPSAQAYLAMAIPLLAALGLMALLKRAPDELRPGHMLAIATAFVWLTSPHYAWYVAWLVPLLVRQASPSVLMFTLLAVVLNCPGNVTWVTHTLSYSVVFGSTALMMAAEWIWSRRCQQSVAAMAC
jgi:alpha-1,6-mannosyltransferase